MDINKKIELFIKSLPKKRQKLIKDDDIEYLKQILSEPVGSEIFQDLISYPKVLEEGKYSVREYINAVRFVSYQMMGYGVTESYLKVFPEKYGHQYLDRYASKYNKSKLVLEIRKLASVPLYLTHHHILQKAIKKQVELMENARSEMVQHQAAKTLMEYLAPPKENQLQLDVTIKKDDSLKQLEEALYKFAEKQVEMIESKKVSTKDIIEIPILERIDNEEENSN